ncbi:hypothetical protein KP509_37G001000 [Ceratopteris richardii]|uniref:CASP-like protein n=1 Tax=Ceratopteris richardii TaxID=49495 RepID=A0A8T2Q5V3_CERRI|nr:hypothetical protein KP509_37G001000 [Ceratopteris richardii]
MTIKFLHSTSRPYPLRVTIRVMRQSGKSLTLQRRRTNILRCTPPTWRPESHGRMPIIRSPPVLRKVPTPHNHRSGSLPYTLGTAVLGSLYCVYAIISIVLRLIDIAISCKKALLWISYIGDQVVLILAVTGVTAAGSSLVSHNGSNGICATYTSLCGSLNIATGTLSISALLLVFTLVISCFYVCKRRT